MRAPEVVRSLAPACAALGILFSLAGCPGSSSKPRPTQAQPRERDFDDDKLDVGTPATKRRPYSAVAATLKLRARKAASVAKKNGRSALVYSRAAAESMQLARLSGDYDDYAQAEAMLEAAFALPDVVPPQLMRAQLHYTLHRLDAAEADLKAYRARPGLGPQEKASVALFEANLDFQRGDWDQAGEKYEALVEGKATPSALAALAYHRWRTGRFDEAEALYERSRSHYGPDAQEPRAWTDLQLGLMDLERGRWDEALEHYRAGTAMLPGYWLLEEHIAEILALKGDTSEARKMYESIVSRTGNPEFMDALAELLSAAGDDEGAKKWVDEARKAYDARMERFPEATYGHALEHYLAHAEPAEAVALAEKNHALRPNPESKLPLAQAYLEAGRNEDARRVIEQALASPAKMAELHAVAAEIYEASSLKKDAASARDAALAINPHALD